jgi:iron(III) transport system permease protein
VTQHSETHPVVISDVEEIEGSRENDGISGGRGEDGGRGGGNPRSAGRKRRIFGPGAVWLIPGLLVALVVVPPVVWMIVKSFTDEGTGAFSFQNFITVFTQPDFQQALLNTVIVAGATAILSTLIAVPAAWAVSRSNMPLGKTIRILILITFVTPPFLGAIAWILLAGSKAGLLNGWFNALTGTDASPFSIYNMAGLILVCTLHQYPFSFILIASSLDSVGSDIELAAQGLGAKKFRVAATITMPLALPAIVGSFMLALLETASLYGTPAMIGIPSGFHVLTTKIATLFKFPIHLELAAALAIPLVIIALVLVYAQRRILGRRSYATVAGKAGARTRTDVGGWRWVWLGYCVLLLTVSTILPYAVLVRASVLKNWVLPFGAGNFTLDNVAYIFSNDGTRSALINSLLLAIIGGVIAVMLPALIAYAQERNLTRAAPLLVLLCLIPMAIPGIAMATGVFAAFAPPPFALYGTLMILLIAYVAKMLPLGYVGAQSTIGGISPSLEDASRILGAGRFRQLRDVTLPLARGGLIAAWALIFMTIMRELSASALLYTPQTRVLSVRFLDLTSEGNIEAASALGILLLVISFMVVGVVYLVAGRNILGGSTD